MDILKHTSSKIEKLESAIDAYKIKLEEMYDLKNQMKDMERDNTRYIEQIIQLEEVSEQQDFGLHSIKTPSKPTVCRSRK